MKKYLISIIVIAGMLLAYPVNADNEPNNSIEEAEVINMGTHSGSVNESFDIYGITIEGWLEIIIEIEVKTASSDLDLRLQDKSGEPITNDQGPIELHPDYLDDSPKWDTWINDQSQDINVYINISGSGSYEFTISEYEEEDEGPMLLTYVVLVILLILFLVGFVGVIIFWKMVITKLCNG